MYAGNNYLLEGLSAKVPAFAGSKFMSVSCSLIFVTLSVSQMMLPALPKIQR